MALDSNRKKFIRIILKLSDNHYLSDARSFFSWKDKKLFWKSILEIKKFIENCVENSREFFMNDEEIQGCNEILKCVDILINKVGKEKSNSEYSATVECRNLSEESSKVLEKIALDNKENVEVDAFIKQEKNLNREEKGGVDWPSRRSWLIYTLLDLADKDFQEREWLGDGYFDDYIVYFGYDGLEDFGFDGLSFDKQCEWYLDVIYKSKKEIELIYKVTDILDKLLDYVYSFDDKKTYDEVYWNAQLLIELRRSSERALNEMLQNDKDNENFMYHYSSVKKQCAKEHALYKQAQKELVRYTEWDLQVRLLKLIQLYQIAIKILKKRRRNIVFSPRQIIRFVFKKKKYREYVKNIRFNIGSLEQDVERLKEKGIKYIRYILGRGPSGKRKKEGLFKEGLLYHYKDKYREDGELLTAISHIDEYIVNM